MWGWFDVKDNRHWPAKSSPTGQSSGAADIRPADIAEPYVAKNSDGEPRSLTLEALRLQFNDNVYFAAPGQGLV